MKIDKKLSETFVGLMCRKSSDVRNRNDLETLSNRETLTFRNKYIAINFSYDNEYDFLRVTITERSTENDIKYLSDYAKAMQNASDIIDYARTIYEVEELVTMDE